jgi:hypothetical protein
MIIFVASWTLFTSSRSGLKANAGSSVISSALIELVNRVR